MASNLVIGGECRGPKFVWERGSTCELGTHDCAAHHTVRKPGTRCTYCKTSGGYYTCSESDRRAFSCSNYVGRHHG